MERAQLIAAVVAVIVIGALVAARFGAGDGAGGPGELAADGPSTDSTATDATDADTADASSPPRSDPANGSAPSDAEPAPPADAPENLGPAGTLRDLDGWLQTDAAAFEDFDGQVRIVQFWTAGCYNCHNTFPALRGIYDRWEPEGLEIIGVHAPEFDWEREVDAILDSADEHGVSWPIALDTDKTNFRDWQPGRRFWPRTFVVDQNGDVRFDHIGEGRYDELEATVAHLVEHGP